MLNLAKGSRLVIVAKTARQANGVRGWNVANAREVKASEARITERDTVSEEGRKVGGDWFGKGCHSPMRLYSSRSSPARKAASGRHCEDPISACVVDSIVLLSMP